MDIQYHRVVGKIGEVGDIFYQEKGDIELVFHITETNIFNNKCFSKKI